MVRHRCIDYHIDIVATLYLLRLLIIALMLGCLADCGRTELTHKRSELSGGTTETETPTGNAATSALTISEAQEFYDLVASSTPIKVTQSLALRRRVFLRYADGSSDTISITNQPIIYTADGNFHQVDAARLETWLNPIGARGTAIPSSSR